MSRTAWLQIICLILAQVALAVVYFLLYYFDVIHINNSQGLALAALVVFNVGLVQLIVIASRAYEAGNVSEPKNTNQSSSSDSAPDSASTPPLNSQRGAEPFWKPSYSFLLGAGLFALAIALHETPPKTIKSDATTVSLIASPAPPPTPAPTPSGAAAINAVPTAAPTPTPVPTPMQCTAILSGLDTLTPGSDAIYDLSLGCDGRAKEPPEVAMDSGGPLIKATEEGKAVTQDYGKSFTWRFLVTVSATTLPAGTVNSFLVTKISTKNQGIPADQSSPVLAVTIKQSKTIDDIKAVIASIGGVIAALGSLTTGFVAFLRGQKP